MPSRRDVLKVGLAVAALPAGARAGLAPPSTLPLYKVVYDTRFPVSLEFAEQAKRRGHAVQAIAGDMTRFWYDDLYHAWRREPAAIAGLTAHGALFCLERLAWDQGLRVVYRGEHVVAGGGVVHRFEGAEPVVAAAAAASATRGWAGALADAVAECPRGGVERARAQATTRDAAAVPPSEALFSWVIAAVPGAWGRA
jgi:hypothetical protein